MKIIEPEVVGGIQVTSAKSLDSVLNNNLL